MINKAQMLRAIDNADGKSVALTVQALIELGAEQLGNPTIIAANRGNKSAVASTCHVDKEKLRAVLQSGPSTSAAPAKPPRRKRTEVTKESIDE